MRAKRRRQPVKFLLDPYYACLIFAGVGVGTLGIHGPARLVLLWLALLLLSLLYLERESVQMRYSLSNVGRGAGLGALLAGTVLLFAFDVLRITSERLFPMGNGASLFQSLFFVSAPIEELFFRGILQRARGMAVASLFYGLTGIVFFLPIAGQFFVVLLAVGLGMGLLGLVYGYVYERYGLAAGIACHALVNVVLFFVPRMVSQWWAG
ncbi:MAG: CPBP family glutamic-type intramembrane protease [Anaerolineae bacterium]|nr:CPBP family glutamic-type intramembrane protease [Anaerolineae bacterium]MDH7473839.1 CPBP family glutamic-type intramembrane protease [Anaerolineae bacterium]